MMKPVRRAEAGNRGEGVRSDLWVEVKPLEGEGLDLQVSSRVEVYYGAALRRQAEDVCRALQLRGASVVIEDSGALPFSIEARLEKAIVEACDSQSRTGSTPALETLGRFEDRAAGPRDRLRRSRLYLPGNDPKLMINAPLHRADGLILDLEDSVAPEKKDEARLLVRNALRWLDFRGAERMVRVNQVPLGLIDLEAIVPQCPELVLLPKCEDPSQVSEADRRIREIQEEMGMEGDIWLMPIVESPLGVERAYVIASASPRVVALTIGLEDYTAELGAPRTVEGRESLHARQTVVNAARAAGVLPIDSVFSDAADEAGLLSSCQEARALGFEGKGCIHPRQVRVVNGAFQPTPAELGQARRIMEAFEVAQREGRSVVSLGRKMIDPPVVKRAQRIVQTARALGLPAGEELEESR